MNEEFEKWATENGFSVERHYAGGYVETETNIVYDGWQASRKQAEWLPIDTAPKDGTVIDLWCASGRRRTSCFWGLPSHCCGDQGRYCDSEWHDLSEGWVDGFDEPLTDEITHWKPLPAAPAVAVNTPPITAGCAENSF